MKILLIGLGVLIAFFTILVGAVYFIFRNFFKDNDKDKKPFE